MKVWKQAEQNVLDQMQRSKNRFLSKMKEQKQADYSTTF